MNIDDLIAELQAAQGDPAKLTLATLDAVLSGTGRPELRPAVEAASIPHWFDADILACLMETDAQSAGDIVAQLRTLPMVEDFPARHGWNVHEATRLALRNHLLETDPERFRRLSARAASCLSGDDPHHRIEAVYHRLVADPQDGADALRQLYSSWFFEGRYEHLQKSCGCSRRASGQQVACPARPRAMHPSVLRNPKRLSALAENRDARGARRWKYFPTIVSTIKIVPPISATVTVSSATLLNDRAGWGPPWIIFEQCLDICRAEVARNPNDWEMATRVVDCARPGSAAFSRAQSRLAEALAEYEASKRIMQELTEARSGQCPVAA